MMLETAEEKRALVRAILPAIPEDDSNFREYLIAFADWEVERVRARFRALENQLELPLKYRHEVTE